MKVSVSYMTRDLDNLAFRRLPRPYRFGRKVLAVRALVAMTSWLKGRLRWRDGHVVWQETDYRLFRPTTTDLVLAQARLAKIARHRTAANSLLGNSDAWIAEQSARLKLAELLSPLEVEDLPALAQGAREHEAQSIEQLITLLVAEALCVNRLPTSPAAALLAVGPYAHGPLQSLLNNTTMPLAGRALAAMLLGALHPKHVVASAPALAEPWLGRTYSWGQQFGLSDQPGLIVTLLAQPDGWALARRVHRGYHAGPSFRLPPRFIRELLADGLSPAEVAALHEAAIAADNLVDLKFLHCSGQIARTIRAYVRATHNPEVITLLAQFISKMLEFGTFVDTMVVVPAGAVFPQATRGMRHQQHRERLAAHLKLADMIKLVLQEGLTLPTTRYKLYLKLLIEECDRIWDRTTIDKDETTPWFAYWVQRRWRQHGVPLLSVLRSVNDPTLIRESITLGVYTELAGYDWTKLPLRPWMLGVVRSLYGTNQDWCSHVLWRTIHSFPTAESAHTVVRPFTDALTAAPAHLRAGMLYHLLDKLLDELESPRDTLPRLMVYLPQIVWLTTQVKDASVAAALLPGLLALEAKRPAMAQVLCDWLVTHLCTTQPRLPEDTGNNLTLELGLRLAAALTDGSVARFQAIVTVAIRHKYDLSWRTREHLLRGIEMLGRIPALVHPLGHLFSQQPNRCVDLLVHLGLATRLGNAGLEPLRQIDVGVVANEANESTMLLASADAGWAGLLGLAPALAGMVGAYLYAQWLCSGSVEVPPGVRHALDQVRKLEAEVIHLEQMLVKQPGRSDLAKRVTNLRARLTDRFKMEHMIQAEAAERLIQLTAEAQLAAAEQQLLACFRARLTIVAGALPADLIIDDDLLNATLLTVDIEHNRGLLRRLLRAHIAGEQHWREQIPGNAAFLAQLREQGVAVNAWLGVHPRRYKCTGASGWQVRVYLERDPIRVLQMGNYFDTCLSFGGINSFSTVTNACELNKRVIYATDATGRVVGRKLIAINEAGTLVGFHSYTGLGNEAGNEALRRIFQRYIGMFARLCGLQLAETGDVSRLVAQEWYDDGIEEWEVVTSTVAPLSGAKESSLCLA